MGMIQDELELAVTRRKLAELEASFEAARARPTQSGYARRLTLQSLRRMINQLTEEIVQYESRAKLEKAAESMKEAVL